MCIIFFMFPVPDWLRINLLKQAKENSKDLQQGYRYFESHFEEES